MWHCRCVQCRVGTGCFQCICVATIVTYSALFVRLTVPKQVVGGNVPTSPPHWLPMRRAWLLGWRQRANHHSRLHAVHASAFQGRDRGDQRKRLQDLTLSCDFIIRKSRWQVSFCIRALWYYEKLGMITWALCEDFEYFDFCNCVSNDST